MWSKISQYVCGKWWVFVFLPVMNFSMAQKNGGIYHIKSWSSYKKYLKKSVCFLSLFLSLLICLYGFSSQNNCLLEIVKIICVVINFSTLWNIAFLIYFLLVSGFVWNAMVLSLFLAWEKWVFNKQKLSKQF